ncbi:MAG: acyl-CoA/acyl-ACP dehydrogenase, partial [Erythrobacter sp.]|nr:acyl-CoA/acyl-ACP dehydrogenase [Erythrobacter sp.]
MRDWIETAERAVSATDGFVAAMLERLAARIAPDGWIDTAAADLDQRLLHGFAWVATTAAALSATCDWAKDAQAKGAFAAVDELVLRIGFGEYCGQIAQGVAMSQSEIVRPVEFSLANQARAFLDEPAVAAFVTCEDAAALRRDLADRLAAGEKPCESFGEETLDLIREQFRAFTASRIAPHAHRWHLEDALIPLELVDEMAALGVFGVCIAEEYGGLGLGKLAMALVSEELSRGWICAGSLGTRSEIAGELIGMNGTAAQKAKYLPRLADGSILPTAVFTEPDAGSDLASLRTRARRAADGSWRIDGAKTWITHAARADLMTVLVRTDPDTPGYGGLSMLLAEKTRGTASDPFPDEGLAGEEIEVLGYRGMREYSLGFEGFAVAEDGLLGGEEGRGFKQLMQTFEGARIQTAARAIGVAWNAFDLALVYAGQRRQFGKGLLAFPRVADKLALMVCEIVMARELTYSAARHKDRGRRCDIEAGMAKLIAARTAWSAADNALQVHGGN